VERKARLDSLEHAMSQNAAQQKAAATPAGPAAAARMSASDSAARAAEIEAIRQELRYRKARLDSLQQEVNSLGKQSKQQKKKAVKPDTSPSKPSGNPPRGLR